MCSYCYLIVPPFPQQSISKAANKGINSDKEYKKKTVNDLSDPKKAKSYAGSLQRAGQTKAIVDYVFNGSRFKLYVPTENCFVMFALANVRCPQPSPNKAAISRGQGETLLVTNKIIEKPAHSALTSLLFVWLLFART